MTLPTPLHAVALEHGAKFDPAVSPVDPAWFGGLAEEYQAATTTAAVFDTSRTAKLVVSGSDAPTFLTNLSTNDLRKVPLGGGCETYFLDHRAKTLFQTVAYHVLQDGNRNALWLETPAGYGQRLLQHLDKYLISEAVELTDVTAQYAQLHVCGPTAADIIGNTLGDTLPPINEFEHLVRTVGLNTVCSIRRRDRLGHGAGYDVVCAADQAEGVWRLFVASGAVPAGHWAFETLRIEAATPVYGIDIDETRFVMEIARVQRAVSYAKGCFIGQEPIIMARDRAGQINRAFVVLGGSEEPLRPGTKLFKDATEVGVVTSSIRSPKWGRPIALAYVRRPHFEIGTRLTTAEPSTEWQVLAVPG